ncbi:adenylate kinase isoenzyme 5 isoform X2 [Nomia melanderi]|uniref:adenylate kinase isoenzyme 5 isoform X2 n=1 Tax=Nomia melanderi TaxID=2448451 RepID=UPI0013042D98|nr:adenylate kinase isoenzyme 5 isoform X2 [Nomia melanderi]XP_031846423.1 adenylate kinase isoenzyme 5 isoform X2 [Nomia melanderi]
MATDLSDEDQQNGSQVFEEADARNTEKWRGEAGLLATPPNGNFPQQNVGPVKFEVPKVPVIFVLGGPGSGKVTHCDNLMQEKKGITHINMMDLLQQYALGNDMQDFGQLSSKTVAEVLMLEIKMSPGAKVFLVSGYPRNMRDVVEYAEKIKIVNGVILVSWRQEILERQIDFGAQLGQVVIELARMELYNFYRNVMPVAEYFDQSGMLLEVNGERNPNDVYVDFREAVFKILGLSTDDTKERNVPPSLEAEVEVERRKESISKSPPPPRREEPPVVVTPLPPVITEKPVKTASKPRKGLPSFIWIIGGPGSNKDNLCSQAVRNMPGWVHVSISSLLRTMATSNTIVKDAIICGELVPQDIVMQVLEQQIILNRDTDGVIIDGYPRDLTQVEEFQNKFGQQPPLVLLDCSKLQLGRGRLDDSVSAFKKRLDLFRELSLPMLKTLDNESRLTIIDGDTDVPSVQQEFAAALYQLMTQSRRKGEENHAARSPLTVDNGNLIGNNRDQILPNGVLKEANNEKPSIENAMNAMNGLSFGGAVQIANGLRNNLKQIQKNGVTRVQNGVANGAAHILQNGVAHLANGIAAGNNKVAPAVQNYVPNDANDAIRKMYNEVEGYQQNLHM